MIDLGATDFYIGVPSMPQHELETYSTRLFDEWEKYMEKALALPDHSLALEVDEGSVKGRGKIAAGLIALYLGIGQYSDFVSGLRLACQSAPRYNRPPAQAHITFPKAPFALTCFPLPRTSHHLPEPKSLPLSQSSRNSPKKKPVP
jgi:hypothetical protein